MYCALSTWGVCLWAQAPDPQQYLNQIRQQAQQNVQNIQRQQQDRIENLKRGVVPIFVMTADGIADRGTGFVVSFTPNSVEIVTAAHVVSEAKSVEVASTTIRTSTCRRGLFVETTLIWMLP